MIIKRQFTKQEAEDAQFVFEHLYGKCHVLAIALHKEIGFSISFFWDDQAYFEMGPNEEDDYYGQALVHAYAVNADGKAFDARGGIDVEEALEEYEVNEPWTHDHVQDDIEGALAESGLEYTTEEYAACVAYIRRNIHLYQ